jgi:hypothetical protein
MGGISSTYTGGTPSSSVLTEQNEGESVEDWIARHFDRLAIAAPTNTTSLTTAWTCDSGQQVEGPTTKEAGETFVQFFRRHREAAEEKMADCPPE